MVDDDALSDSTEGGMAVEVVESVWSMDSSSKTPRRTLELARQIGKRPIRMLIDSGTTGNYVSAQECAARKIKIEKEKNGKELTMADGSKVKTIGQVRLIVRCGGYQGIVEARVFPEMSKPMILGMPWLVKEIHISIGHAQQWWFNRDRSGFHYHWRVWMRTSQCIMSIKYLQNR